MNNLQKIIRSVQQSRKLIFPVTYGPLNNLSKVINRNYAEIQEKDSTTQTFTGSHEATKAYYNNQAETEENKYEEDIKKKIMDHALVTFAVESGFSLNSLTAAGQAMGYPGVVHGLFPQGGAELLHYFNVKCNEELAQKMKEWQKDLKPEKSSGPPIEFIKTALITRILMIEPYKRHWPRALSMQTLPSNVSNSLATLLSMVDDICYYAGDRSVDFNWYIRRVGLAGIYKASELYFLTDNSPEYVATSNFVHTRLSDAELIQAALSVNPVIAAPQTLSAAFTTAKNMLGLNSLRS